MGPSSFRQGIFFILIALSVLEKGCGGCQRDIKPPAPPALVMTSQAYICGGGVVVIGPVPVQAYTYQWSPPFGLSDPTSPNPSASPATTTIYTLTVTDPKTGLSSQGSVTVVVSPIPIADAGPSKTICLGSSTVLGTPPITGMSYTWSPSAGLSSTQTARPQASPSSTTAYTLTVSDNATGCTGTSSVSVTVILLPVADAGVPKITTAGCTVTLGAAPQAGLSYTWTPSAGLSAVNVAQPAATISTTGFYPYTLTVVNLATGCSNVSGTTVQVNPQVFNYLTISAIAPQTALNPFTINSVAFDTCGLLMTEYSSAAFLLDLTSTLSPPSGTFLSGQLSQSVSICTSTSADTLTVTTADGFSVSNAFSVSPGGLDHFSLSPVGSPQAAGSPFTFTATARDACNNIITGYALGATLSDTTGTLTFTPAAFSGGYLTATARVFRAAAGDTITLTSGGKTAFSIGFAVLPGPPSSFLIEPISGPQIAGTLFSITVTAYDAYGNVVTGYTAAAAISDTTGSVSPVSGSFVNGVLLQLISVCAAAPSDTITVSNTDGFTVSSSFSVVPGSLDHIDLSTIGSPQTAGAIFTFTAGARDACGNVATGYNQGAVLSDTTGTLSFTPAAFSGGYLTVTARVTMATTGNTITLTTQGKSSTSNPFSVEPGPLDHFTSGPIGSQQAGVPFTATFTARDAYENLISSFAGLASITNTTATVSPNSGNFSGGYLTSTVSVCGPSPLDALTVSYAGNFGISNVFPVVSGPAFSIDISTISSPQAVGKSFILRAKALDSCGNIAAGFTSGAALYDLTASLTPAISSFTGGYLTEPVTISTFVSGDSITVSSSAITSTSNPFDVEVPTVDHFYVWAPSAVTAGQAFTIYIEARDITDTVISGFTGTAGLSDSTSTIDPTITGTFAAGVITQTIVSICGASASDAIVVQGAGTYGTSNTFTVSPGSLHHLSIKVIPSPQGQAVPFTLTAYAEDSCGNTITIYNDPSATLSDTTSTLTPSIGGFFSGVLSLPVAVCASSGGDSITVASGGKAATSSTFAVSPGLGPADHIIMDPLTSPLRTGTLFSISVAAYDVCSQHLTGYNQSASITDTTATISPPSGSFAAGLLTQSEVVCQPSFNDIITISSGGKITSSAGFTVSSPADAGGDTYILTSGSALLGTPALAGYTYSWTCDRPSCFLVSPTQAQPLASPLSTTTYTVAASQAGCSNLSSTTVFVNMYVTFTVPPDGSTDNPINSIILAAFSEPLDALTLNTGTFWLTDWTFGTPVSWTGTSVTYDASTQTAGLFHTGLTTGDSYVSTLSTGIKSIYGNSLFSDFSFGFDTGGTDITPPTVVFTTPSTPAPLNADITATYSEYLSPTSISGSTITAYAGASVVTGTIAYDIPSMTVIFTPFDPLISTTSYTAVAKDAKDLANIVQTSNPYTWTFTTGTALDFTPPSVSGVSPSPGATGAPSSVIVSVAFSEPMNPLTINANTFYLLSPLGSRVAATMTYSTATATAYLTPSNFLSFNTTYTVTVTGGAGCTGVKDLAGNCMGTTFTSTFTTGGDVFWDNMEAGGCTGSGITLPCWTSSGGWAFSTQYYKSPVRSYGISSQPDGTYTLTSGDISIPSSSAPSLSFWQRYKLYKSGPNRDRGLVEIQKIGGACVGTSTTLGTFTGVKQNFARQTYSLSNYAGCTVRIIFELQAWSNKGEWYIDDVLIQ